jgi:hypothetical protein
MLTLAHGAVTDMFPAMKPLQPSKGSLGTSSVIADWADTFLQP